MDRRWTVATGGQGPGKADNWRAGSREGGQLAGRAQGRRTTGGQGLGKADNWRAGPREGGLVGPESHFWVLKVHLWVLKSSKN